MVQFFRRSLSFALFFFVPFLYGNDDTHIEESARTMLVNHSILCSAAFERHVEVLFDEGYRNNLQSWTDASKTQLLGAIFAYSKDDESVYEINHSALKFIRDYYHDLFRSDEFNILYFQIMTRCDLDNVEKGAKLYDYWFGK